MSSLVINLLIIFGLLSISLYLVTLAPMASLAIMIAVILTIVGGLFMWRSKNYAYLGQICMTLGAISLTCGFVWGQHIPFNSPWAVLIVLGIYTLLTENCVLLILAIINLFIMFASFNFYSYSLDSFWLTHPLAAIVAMAILALLMLKPSQLSPTKYQRLALITARTSLFLLNVGFWIGSIWGSAQLIFSITWFIVLLLTAIWAWRSNKRWVMNITCIFAVIHFYSQWLIRSASPLSLLLAGVLMVVFAVGLKTLNKVMKKKVLPVASNP